jgi:hypothetical protein
MERATSIGRYNFEWVALIDPVRNPDGSVKEFAPQSRYRNQRALPLNKYGNRPFCKFKIANRHNVSGVYAIVVDGKPKYVGECASLSRRFNMGYGNISPRNCFLDGQETNCRINSLVHIFSTQGVELSLWFLRTNDYKSIEEALRMKLKPEWNRN